MLGFAGDLSFLLDKLEHTLSNSPHHKKTAMGYDLLTYTDDQPSWSFWWKRQIEAISRRFLCTTAKLQKLQRQDFSQFKNFGIFRIMLGLECRFLFRQTSVMESNGKQRIILFSSPKMSACSSTDKVTKKGIKT